MSKRLVPTIIFIAYSAILVKVMVFKDLPLIKVGSLMLNFGGTDGGHPANFMPFRTILPYLFGHKGLIIAGINLIGNIALLVPIGFLLPLVHRNISWKKALIVAVASGLSIEILQTVLRVGIFDIDDVILNALGAMIGYWIAVVLIQWARSKNYKNIVIASLVGIVAVAVLYGTVVYPITHQSVTPRIGAGDFDTRDLCGGTGGNGQIVSVGNNTFTIKQRDGRNQVITLTDQAAVETSTGPASASDLKTGDRVTLVGGPNPDGSFTAEAVFVCAVPSPEIEQ
jgi:glycopeptide antibiotics resistance protein